MTARRRPSSPSPPTTSPSTTSTKAPQASLPLIVAFCASVEEGSFTGAARRLRLLPAAVSRSVKKLEDLLDVTLFRRTTRQLRLTPAGARYYDAVKGAVRVLVDAEGAVHDDERGVVRLSVPTTVGLTWILPALAPVLAALPHIDVDVRVENAVADFVDDDCDVAVRLGGVSSLGAGLVAKKLVEWPLGLYASPAYVRAHGAPRTPDDLAQHALLPFVLPRAGRVLPWLFAGPDEELVPHGRVRTFVDPVGMLALARGGAGICQIYQAMAAAFVDAGALVPLLPARAGRTRTFSLVYRRQGQSPAARAFVQALVAALAQERKNAPPRRSA